MLSMASSSGANPSAAPPFFRERHRQPSGGDSPRLSTPSLPRRRSSILSLASDTRQSVHSSASDLLYPAATDQGAKAEEDVESHWHSSPLLFALLPGLGGIFFTNGAAFITDILLLGIAALYLNWSVRQPWQWYYAAQALNRTPQPVKEEVIPPAETKIEPGASPRSSHDSGIHVEDDGEDKEQDDVPDGSESAEEAAHALRMHETVALAATFVFPALGALLLHFIRGQLSKGSTALVSDYNLTIFLLAAEIRPVRQVMKLLSSRTLHLQRMATGVDQLKLCRDTEKNAEVESRLEILEAKIAEPTNASVPNPVQKEEMAQLASELRKRYESRIDALERASRRYEKKVTTLSILMDQRLQSLDQRLQDALSLAAVAAQSSQKPSVISAAFAYAGRAIAAPIELAVALITWPLRKVEDAIRLVLGTPAKGPAIKKRTGDKPAKSSLRSKDRRLGRDEVSAVPST